MEVILKETIDNLGQEGDIVRVKPGYARNYLIPQQKAEPVTKSSLIRLERNKKKIAERLAALQQEAETLAGRLEGKVITIVRKVGEEDRLFGSVTAKDIAQELANMNVHVDRKAILLGEPIKTVGESEVLVKVGYQMNSRILVQVMPEDAVAEEA